MLSTFEFYIVSEEKLPSEIPAELPLQERYERIVSAVREHGARWDMVEMYPQSLYDALAAVGKYMSWERLLPGLKPIGPSRWCSPASPRLSPPHCRKR